MDSPGIGLDAVRRAVARMLPRSASFTVERAETGVSTPVYRVRSGEEVFYLRLAETPEASLAPEARVHALLRGRGVRAPEVVYFEELEPALGRSAMLTAEIRGEPIGRVSARDGPRRVSHGERDLRPVLREAGRDLALINTAPVRGFGWVARDRGKGEELEAGFPTHREWVAEHIEQLHALRREGVLTEREGHALDLILCRFDAYLDVDYAFLAHGDLDATHIYHEGGRYTGIIDFGEIRGASPLYDLGHFRAHDGETLPWRVLPYLLDGYGEVAPLPPDYERRIAMLSMLIAGRALARHLMLGRSGPFTMHLLAAVRRDLETLAS